MAKKKKSPAPMSSLASAVQRLNSAVTSAPPIQKGALTAKVDAAFDKARQGAILEGKAEQILAFEADAAQIVLLLANASSNVAQIKQDIQNF